MAVALKAESSPENLRTPTFWCVLDVVFVCVLCMITLLRLWEFTQIDIDFLGDDALITLVYARSLAEGSGFVYNEGAPSLGTTSPLWTFLNAFCALALPNVDLRTSALFLHTAIAALTGWLFLLFRKSFHLRVGEAALIGTFSLLGGQLALRAGEIPLLQFLLICAVASVLCHRWVITGVLTGLMFLTRGEGILMLGIAGPLLLVHHWKALRGLPFRDAAADILRLGAGFCAVAGPWVLYSTWTFGVILPNTMRVKVAQGRWFESQGQITFLPNVLELLGHWVKQPGYNWGLPALALAALLVLGFVAVCWLYPRLLPMFAWGSASLAGYTLLNVPSNYVWYAATPLWGFACLAGVGAAALVFELPIRRSRPVPWAAAAALAVLSLTIMRACDYSHILPIYKDPRALQYHRASAWMRENLKPGDTVACAEVGYLAWYNRIRPVDLCGLTNPEAFWLVSTRGELESVRALRPTYYLTYLPQPKGSHAEKLEFPHYFYERVALFKTSTPQHQVALYRIVGNDRRALEEMRQTLTNQ